MNQTQQPQVHRSVVARPALYASLAIIGLLGTGCRGNVEPQQTAVDQVMLTPNQMRWEPLPAPAGAEIANLIGSRAQPGFYLQRVRYPANFINQPHSHPENRTYTVISGTIYIGFGDIYDASKLKKMPAGSFWTEPANMNHFLTTKGTPVEFQITGIAPSATNHVSPTQNN